MPPLLYNSYPPYPELRCDGCLASNQHTKERAMQQKIPGVGYKDGEPYNCNCDLITSPYSYPYESFVNSPHTVCPVNHSSLIPSKSAFPQQPSTTSLNMCTVTLFALFVLVALLLL